MDCLAEGCTAQLPGNVQYTAAPSGAFLEFLEKKEKSGLYICIREAKLYQTPEMPEKEVEGLTREAVAAILAEPTFHPDRERDPYF